MGNYLYHNRDSHNMPVQMPKQKVMNLRVSSDFPKGGIYSLLLQNYRHTDSIENNIVKSVLIHLKQSQIVFNKSIVKSERTIINNNNSKRILQDSNVEVNIT